MRYRKFIIENYRGIEKTEIELPFSEGAQATTLIGLNESGKTTILEAIYSFSPDSESKALYDSTVLLSDDPSYFIPRNHFSNFNDASTVEATVSWTSEEIDVAIKLIKRVYDIHVDTDSLPLEFSIQSGHKFVASKHAHRIHRWNIQPKVRTGKQVNLREPTTAERQKIISSLLTYIPRIAYFPTFVFDFPEKIYLSGGPVEGKKKALNDFYKKIFQSVLDSGGQGHNIDQHIVKRFDDTHARTKDGAVVEAVAKGSAERSNREMIKQTVDRAADTVSDFIIRKWDEIFTHSPVRKEISIEAHDNFTEYVDESISHDVWIEFKVRDSGNRYNIADRSLGFRWFFCFLLFTKFMSGQNSNQGILFLFDEPASNLHAKAQEKLLESFGDISRRPNSLIFSTHSHYMVNPMWLERAYIVKNDAIDYADPSGEGRNSSDARIEAIKYRKFVSEADQGSGSLTYFQPVLDRLDVKPSQLELQSECIVVEGKSDYHILAYVRNNYLKSSVAIVPALGASTMKPVIAILRGWGSRYLIVLDDDKAGRVSQTEYREAFDLEDEVRLLSDFSSANEIEGLFEIDDLDRLKDGLKLPSKPRKKTLSRLFQEANAAGTKLPLSRDAITRLKSVLRAMNDALVALPK